MIIEAVALALVGGFIGGLVGYRLGVRKRPEVVVWHKKPGALHVERREGSEPRPRQRNVSVRSTSRDGNVVSGRKTIMKTRHR